MNKDLFQSAAAAPPDTVNHAGGAAYEMPAQEALAQMACTGVFADTFYVKADEQLDKVVALAKQCPDDFVAKVAVYARQAGFLKDAPAVLIAYLFGKQSPVLDRALFDAVIDNAKMLSNFVQAVRSAKFGRRSLGTKGKRLVADWLNGRPVDYLFRQSIAKDPSLADVIRLSRPKAVDPQRNALYRYLIGKPVEVDLPQLVTDTIAFREDQTKPLPDVPFNMIDSVPLTKEHWLSLFERGGLQFLRMNLNTAARHGVFGDESVVAKIAARFSNREEVQRSKQFPYQWLTAYGMAIQNPDLPAAIREGLHDAMEYATCNVPSLNGNVYVAVDCSGSMSSPVTGYRGRQTTSVTCADVAALFAASILRTSPQAKVMTFSDQAQFVPVDPRDTTMTIAQRLAQYGGGTDCSAPLRLLNERGDKVDLFLLISDNESWLDGGAGFFRYMHRNTVGSGRPTGTVEEWATLKRRCPNAKQVRINITPNATDQLPKRSDTLRVGGFSDAVFTAIRQWYDGLDWVETIRSFTT